MNLEPFQLQRLADQGCGFFLVFNYEHTHVIIVYEKLSGDEQNRV
jgi:hypothetical protein